MWSGKAAPAVARPSWRAMQNLASHSRTQTTKPCASSGFPSFFKMSSRPSRSITRRNSSFTTSLTTTRHGHTSAGQQPTSFSPRPPTPRKPSGRSLARLLLALSAGAGISFYALTPSTGPLSPNHVFDPDRFTPFDLVTRDPVSPTSFVLTLRPSPSFFASSLTPEDIATQLVEPWEHYDLWAVEVKQPQLQIAREYTPLPPGGKVKGMEKGDDAYQQCLRLYVRAVDGGEVSTYLSRLPIGSRVELRGPRAGFDLNSRLGREGSYDDEQSKSEKSEGTEMQQEKDAAGPGPGREVVFLAGGTGIATALQAAHAVLGTPQQQKGRDSLPETPKNTQVRIIWAVRSRSEVYQQFPGTNPVPTPAPTPPTRPPPQRSWWSFLTGKPPSNTKTELSPSTLVERPTNITQQLLDMQARHGNDKLTVHYVVDDEGTYISAADILEAMKAGTGVAPALVNEAAAAAVSGGHGARGAGAGAEPRLPPCPFHAQPPHALATDGAPNAGRRDLFKRWKDCPCPTAAPAGKNLLLVSGPDGFVATYAGARSWRGGGQMQGRVGGVLEELEGREPGLLGGWIVLKM